MTSGGREITPLEYRETREALRRALAGGHCVTVSLPWRTRLRLWLTRLVDNAAYWLACHGRSDMAMRLYKISRLR